jgi:hypothetical protein
VIVVIAHRWLLHGARPVALEPQLSEEDAACPAPGIPPRLGCR